MRVAIVHPWFLALGGAEQTVGVMAELYPKADIFTLFYEERSLPSQLLGRNIISSRWNWLPYKYWYYRYLLPLYPMAIEGMDLRGYDLVLSSDSCIAKGILPDCGTTHVCFCHSPMRCLYDQYRQTLEGLPWTVRKVFRCAAHYLRIWDYIAAHRVTGFAANSVHIASRIRSYYGLESKVIYPPVDTSSGFVDPVAEDYYLCVGRLVSCKRIDLIIDACNRLQRRLIIVGEGRELAALKMRAGPTIEFAGRVSQQRLSVLYSRCKALLFAAEEDFGIVPVECQAYGRPVIAYGKGGALETVVPRVTGILFKEQSVDSLAQAMLEFERGELGYDPLEIQANASSFERSVFKRQLYEFVDACIEAKRTGRPWHDLERKNPNMSALVPAREAVHCL